MKKLNKTDFSTLNNDNSINQSFEEEIRISRITVSVYQILKWVDNDELDIDKDNRIDITWSHSKKSYYIETILIGFPSPYIYMCEERDGSRTVIDGINRIATLIEFINNEFKLGHLNQVENCDNCFFKDLDYNFQRRFLDSTVDLCIINSDCSPSSRYDIYKRVNKNCTRMLQIYLYSACKPALRKILLKMENLWKTNFSDTFKNKGYFFGQKFYSLGSKKMFYQKMSVFWISSIIAYGRNSMLDETFILEYIDLVNKLDDGNLKEMYEDFERSIKVTHEFIESFHDKLIFISYNYESIILICSVIFKIWNVQKQDFNFLINLFYGLLNSNNKLQTILASGKIMEEKLFFVVKEIDKIMESGQI